MHKKIACFIIGGLTTIIFLVFTWDIVFKYFGVLTKINYIFYDASLKVFHKKNRSDTVVIVDIDEKSLKYEGRWPWPRSKVAALVKALQDSGAAVIVFDIFFPEQESNVAAMLLQHARQNPAVSPKIIDYLSQQLPYFDGDKILAETLTKGDVVLGEFFNDDLYHPSGKLVKPTLNLTKPKNLLVSHQSKFIGNIPLLVDAVHYAGFTTTVPDEDGVIRRSPLLIEYNNGLYPALALEAIRAYLLTDKLFLDLYDLGTGTVFLGIKLGDIYIPTDAAGNILINYSGPAFSFPGISAADVIHSGFSPRIFAGKIVLIGASATGIGDLHSTPLQSAGYPGVEVHASIISSILNKSIISSPVWLIGVERILIIIVSLVFIILAAYYSVFVLILLTLFMLVLLFAINTLLLVKWCWILPHLMLPYLQVLFLGMTNSCYGYLFETRYRKKLHDVYGQYVSSAHIDQMLETRGQDRHGLAGNTKIMTVLFSDIRNFTSISEKLDAKEVKKFLGNLFTPLTEIIFEHKGTIDKYVGDMIVAFWNDPIDDPEHALHGVQTALMMQNKVRELAPVFAEQNITNVGIRIGVNTGMMHVGDMGSKYRKSYTVLGDSVNLGSRLEGVNKIYGTKILVSQEIKNMCSGVVFRFIDCVYVKGKETATNIYEPLCLSSNNTSIYEAELAQYNQALEFYNAHNWGRAQEEFAKLTAQYPQVEVYAIYLKRVAQYVICPPPENWDRGQHLTEK